MRLAGISDEVLPEHVPLQHSLQDEIAALFKDQADRFLKDEFERIEFNPRANYRLEREQIFVVKEFALPSQIESAALKPHTVPDFSLERQPRPLIPTVFSTNASPEKVERILFQQFRTPQFLDKRLALLWSRNQFQRISNDGSSLAHDLAAVYQFGNLYFRSLAVANRFLDLSEFQPEATKEEIVDFVGNTLFTMEDETRILRIIEGDSWLRRRVASIQSCEILKNVTPRRAANKAKVFGIDIEVSRVKQKDRIVLSKEQKELKSWSSS